MLQHMRHQHKSTQLYRAFHPLLAIPGPRCGRNIATHFARLACRRWRILGCAASAAPISIQPRVPCYCASLCFVSDHFLAPPWKAATLAFLTYSDFGVSDSFLLCSSLCFITLSGIKYCVPFCDIQPTLQLLPCAQQPPLRSSTAFRLVVSNPQQQLLNISLLLLPVFCRYRCCCRICCC